VVAVCAHTNWPCAVEDWSGAGFHTKQSLNVGQTTVSQVVSSQMSTKAAKESHPQAPPPGSSPGFPGLMPLCGWCVGCVYNQVLLCLEWQAWQTGKHVQHSAVVRLGCLRTVTSGVHDVVKGFCLRGPLPVGVCALEQRHLSVE